MLSLVRVIQTTWIAFVPAYFLLQLMGEYVVSMPVLISLAFPMDVLNGTGLFSVVGGWGVDYLICGFNALCAAFFIEDKASRKQVGAALLAYSLSVITLWAANLSPALIEHGRLNVVTVDNNLSFTRVTKIPYSIAEKEAIESEMDTLTKQAIAMKPELIVWPEGGNGLANRQLQSRHKAFKQLAAISSYQLLAGSKDYANNGTERNVADFIVNGDFISQIEKSNPVPFLESHVNRGDNGLISVDGNTIGVNICFDIAFAQATNQLVNKGAAAIIVITNDSSFGYSALTYMHMRYAAVRAMETGRDILFASNTGPSIVITDKGVVQSGYIHADGPRLFEHVVRTRSGSTIYRQAPALLSMLVLILVVIYLMWIKRRCR
ncbi:MAG: apolipoprotein N-acyltransferase [Pseudomonadales bacterium]|jgi:apolipoprotein N-acyltransferase